MHHKARSTTLNFLYKVPEAMPCRCHKDRFRLCLLQIPLDPKGNSEPAEVEVAVQENGEFRHCLTAEEAKKMTTLVEAKFNSGEIRWNSTMDAFAMHVSWLGMSEWAM